MPSRVHQDAIEVVSVDLADRVERPADPQVQIAAAGQLDAAIGGNAAGAADGQDQALAAGADVLRLRRRVENPRIAAHINVKVASSQGAEAREPNHLVRARVGHAGHVGTKVDPPRGGLRLVATEAVALTPQPVADVG
ncbi:hypothetical protein [Pseudomonas sp. 22 E 5]|nr:hypothetical protein [Pseudomonas sp. 22 E 5]